MKVSLDGGITFIEATNGVRIIYEEVDIGDNELSRDLHINLTDEGVIMDVWVTRDIHLDTNIATSCQTTEEIVESLTHKDRYRE